MNKRQGSVPGKEIDTEEFQHAVVLHMFWRRIVHSFFDAMIYVYTQLVVAFFGNNHEQLYNVTSCYKSYDGIFCDSKFVAIHKLGADFKDFKASCGFEI